jgi:hypothetical protein
MEDCTLVKQPLQLYKEYYVIVLRKQYGALLVNVEEE